MSANKENRKPKKFSRCQVDECTRQLNKSLHNFPKDLIIKHKWFKALKLCPFGNDNMTWVCEDHFKAEDYYKVSPQTKRKRLLLTAVPSLNLPSKKKLCTGEHRKWKNALSDHNYCVNGNKFIDHDLQIRDNDKLSNAKELFLDCVDQMNGPEMFDEELEISGDNELCDERVPLSEHLYRLKDSINKEQCADDKLAIGENELAFPIDWSCEKEDITDLDNEIFAVIENLSFKYYEANIQQSDESIQTNLAYDEAIKPITLLDWLYDDSGLESWTGIPDFETLENIVKCVKNISSASSQLKKFKATPQLLTALAMTKLKTNLSFKQLSYTFKLRPTTLSIYFVEYIPILKAALKPAVFWPTKHQILKNLSRCFSRAFQDCCAIMDGTEMSIARLKSLSSRITTYSHYKGTNTAKINITTTPSGIIIHVSKVWGGKASDKHIVLSEQILENFSSGDGLMVDKGYNIANEAAVKGIRLYRPPLLDQPQHTKDDAIYNTEVAGSRIHVERVIQRLKKFNLFKSKINRSMLKLIDDIVFIACAITNLSAPILADDKF